MVIAFAVYAFDCADCFFGMLLATFLARLFLSRPAVVILSVAESQANCTFELCRRKRTDWMTSEDYEDFVWDLSREREFHFVGVN